MPNIYDVVEQDITVSGTSSDPVNDVAISVTLTPPTGSPFTISGFFHSVVSGDRLYKFRYMPKVSGTWNWSGTKTISGVTTTLIPGSHSIGATATRKGHIKRSTTDSYALKYDNGTPAHIVGTQICISALDAGASGWSASVGDPANPGQSYITLDNWLALYAEQSNGAKRFNLFRIFHENCSASFFTALSSTTLTLNDSTMLGLDNMCQKMLAAGMRVMLGLFSHVAGNNFEPNMADSGVAAQVYKYCDYLNARYGAYVDFWEVVNEAQPGGFPAASIQAIAQRIRLKDVYAHEISASYVYGGSGVANTSFRDYPELGWVDFHAYIPYDDITTADNGILPVLDRQAEFGKPTVVGELGSGIANYSSTSDDCARKWYWTLFFNKAYAIAWDYASQIPYNGGGAANLFVGNVLRGYIQVFSQFIDGFPFGAKVTPGTNFTSTLRTYGMSSATHYGCFIHSTAAGTTISGKTLTIAPSGAGTGQFYNTKTGATVGAAFAATGGTQTVTIPDFTDDIALKIVSSGGTEPPPPTPAPVASFTKSASSGVAPLTVNFTDTSTNTPTSWLWNFGTGQGTSTAKNPSKDFQTPGTYQVTLTATNAGGSSTSAAQMVTVNAPPDTTPAAPTAFVTDDTADNFNWTYTSGITTIADYEYTTNSGTSYSDVTAKPQPVGNVALGVGKVGIRVKAATGRTVSATLYNTVAFTTSTTPGDLLLDNLATPAYQAFSIRKLRTAYTGFCMKVRPTGSTGAGTDIGFGANGFIDETALAAIFNPEVLTWYDQSGNGRNGTGVDGATPDMPRLYPNTVNGKSSIAYATGSHFTLGNPSALTAGEVARFTKVSAQPTTDPTTGFWNLGTDSTSKTHYPYTDTKIYNAFASTVRKAGLTPTQSLFVWHTYQAYSAPNDWRDFINNSPLRAAITTNTVGFPSNALLGHSSNLGGNYYHMVGNDAEFILFGAKLSDADRAAVASSQATAFISAPDTTPPTVPGTPTFSNITSSGMRVSYAGSTDTQSGILGYELQRAADADTAFSSPTNYPITTALFQDISGLTSGTSYRWRVRAIDNSPNQNPSAYSSASTQATLTIAPVASFTRTPASGTAPLAVSVTNTSTGGTATTHIWNWGDGTANSTAQNPSAHLYTVAGVYTITLTETNSGGSSTATATVTVNAPATAGRIVRTWEGTGDEG